MLAKLTSKNQVTLPVELVRSLPAAEYFDATLEQGAIVLRPVRVIPALDLERIRDAVAAAGASEADVPRATRWARKRRR
jgi:hypothetical protein